MVNNIKISLITPTIRPELLAILAHSLRKQDFEGNVEWLIGSRKELLPQIDKAIKGITDYVLVEEPKKKSDDFYALCKCWNKLMEMSQGELIIVVQDGISFPPDMLSRFWGHYQNNPKGLVTVIGHHYDQLDQYGKPVNMMWQDPRARTDLGAFYEVPPSEMEMAVCSVPKQAVLDCGGMDEDYDKGPAVGEKEMCWRLDKLGYKFYIDQTIEYRAIHHPRLTSNWDEMYLKVSTPLFIKHMDQLQKGQRPLKLDYVK